MAASFARATSLNNANVINGIKYRHQPPQRNRDPAASDATFTGGHHPGDPAVHDLLHGMSQITPPDFKKKRPAAAKLTLFQRCKVRIGWPETRAAVHAAFIATKPGPKGTTQLASIVITTIPVLYTSSANIPLPLPLTNTITSCTTAILPAVIHLVPVVLSKLFTATETAVFDYRFLPTVHALILLRISSDIFFGPVAGYCLQFVTQAPIFIACLIGLFYFRNRLPQQFVTLLSSTISKSTGKYYTVLQKGFLRAFTLTVKCRPRMHDGDSRLEYWTAATWYVLDLALMATTTFHTLAAPGRAYVVFHQSADFVIPTFAKNLLPQFNDNRTVFRQLWNYICYFASLAVRALQSFYASYPNTVATVTAILALLLLFYLGNKFETTRNIAKHLLEPLYASVISHTAKIICIIITVIALGYILLWLAHFYLPFASWRVSPEVFAVDAMNKTIRALRDNIPADFFNTSATAPSLTNELPPTSTNALPPTATDASKSAAASWPDFTFGYSAPSAVHLRNLIASILPLSAVQQHITNLLPPIDSDTTICGSVLGLLALVGASATTGGVVF
jgi:hypothetical protein